MAAENILIVEDNGILAAMWEDVLAEVGYTILGIEATGESAVTTAAERRPDLILMDITLAGEMDGITAAEHIRAASDIPIIFLTGYSQPLLLEQAKNVEPYSYFVKPVDIEGSAT